MAPKLRNSFCKRLNHPTSRAAHAWSGLRAFSSLNSATGPKGTRPLRTSSACGITGRELINPTPFMRPPTPMDLVRTAGTGFYRSIAGKLTCHMPHQTHNLYFAVLDGGQDSPQHLPATFPHLAGAAESWDRVRSFWGYKVQHCGRTPHNLGLHFNLLEAPVVVSREQPHLFTEKESRLQGTVF